MKYSAKLLALLLCATLLFHVTACGKKPDGSTETATKKQSAFYQIGICRFQSDSFSEEMIQGFQDALKIKLKEDNISFSLKEANGDSATLNDICAELDSENLNLIFLDTRGLATNIDTNAYKTKIVTTPELPAIEQAEDTLLQLLPDISLPGILYDNTDSSSLACAEEFKRNLEADGISYKEYTATDADSLKENANNICDQCDSLYIISSDLMSENINMLADTFLPAGIPAVADSEELRQTSIASVFVSAGDFGMQLGNIAAEYLLNNTEPNAAQLDTSELIKKYYNPVICEYFEIEVPDGMIAMPAEQVDTLLLQ